MYLVLISCFLLFFVLIFFLLFHIISFCFGAPYLATGKERREEMIEIAHIKKGEKTVDLGSGNGNIVIAMAKKGAYADGYEINPFYVLLSKWKIKQQKLEENAHIYWRNYWHVDFSPYDIITIYGISYIMDALEKKLKQEIKSKTQVISSCYRFKHWKPEKKIGYIFLYKK
jgi:16S rRNA A1518/A1519 N6-dimethyltransferase RsmA/KsgA/DIM1 with predicted DNA glycosylase/AP lyase activity